MNWFKRNIGLDWFDLALHLGITMMLMAAAATAGVANEEETIPLIGAAGLVALAVRRHVALRRLASVEREGLTSGQMAAVRFEEMEQRLAELEAASARITELEDRLEFTERLIAQTSGERARIDAGGAGRG